MHWPVEGWQVPPLIWQGPGVVQSTAAPRGQTPPEHTSPLVHASPSLHEMPLQSVSAQSRVPSQSLSSPSAQAVSRAVQLPASLEPASDTPPSRYLQSPLSAQK